MFFSTGSSRYVSSSSITAAAGAAAAGGAMSVGTRGMSEKEVDAPVVAVAVMAAGVTPLLE